MAVARITLLLSAAEGLGGVKIEQIGWGGGGWVGNYLVTFFVKRYLRNYNRAEVESLHVGRRLIPITHPVF